MMTITLVFYVKLVTTTVKLIWTAVQQLSLATVHMAHVCAILDLSPTEMIQFVDNALSQTIVH